MKNNEKHLLVNKSYKLNAMRQGYATLREQRLLATYLAKINPFDPKTRTVRFSLFEFIELCDLKDIRDIKISDYKKIIKKILNKTIVLPTENGGLCGFVLFEKCLLEKDCDTSEWFFEITATKSAIQFLFDIKPYFSYNLQNILKLKSLNQIRLYEVLKQRQKLITFDIKLSDLREWLFITPKEYPEFKHFKTNVLDICKKAINEFTDISFFYTTKRIGRKVGIISFTIIPKSIEQLKEMNKSVKKQIPLVTKIDSDYSLNYPVKTLKEKSDNSNCVENEKKAELILARNNPLWNYALEIAKKSKYNLKTQISLERYAVGIIKNWNQYGYKSKEDLIDSGQISDYKDKNLIEAAYDLDFF